MSTFTAKLTVSHKYTRANVPKLLAQGDAVFTNMSAEAELFSASPVPLPVFKQNLDNLRASSTAAMDGGKKDITQRDKDRHVVEQDLKLLGVYVEKVSGGDAAILASSGFVAAPPRASRAAQPLEQPFIRSIDHGNSGQLLVFAKPVAKARTYDIRYAPLVNGVPGNWTTVTVTSARKSVTISGLTPGATYAFQVRALGRLGSTDWSDSATRMSV